VEAAGLLEEAGRAEEAITWLRSRAEAGDTRDMWRAPAMLEQAARMLEEAGRAEEAAWLRRYGIEPGGRIADPWGASGRA
jgi:hypothetical protein